MPDPYVAVNGWNIIWDEELGAYHLNGKVVVELLIQPECSDFNHSTVIDAAIHIDRRGPEEYPNFDLPVVKLSEYDEVKEAIEEFESVNGKEDHFVEREDK